MYSTEKFFTVGRKFLKLLFLKAFYEYLLHLCLSLCVSLSVGVPIQDLNFFLSYPLPSPFSYCCSLPSTIPSFIFPLQSCFTPNSSFFRLCFVWTCYWSFIFFSFLPVIWTSFLLRSSIPSSKNHLVTFISFLLVDFSCCFSYFSAGSTTGLNWGWLPHLGFLTWFFMRAYYPRLFRVSMLLVMYSFSTGETIVHFREKSMLSYCCSFSCHEVKKGIWEILTDKSPQI